MSDSRIRNAVPAHPAPADMPLGTHDEMEEDLESREELEEYYASLEDEEHEDEES